MAGTLGTITFTEITHGTVKKIKAAWTAGTGDYAGEVEDTTEKYYDGRIIGVATVPGTAGDQPDDNYNVAVQDDDGIDLLLGNGASRDEANTEFIAEASCAGLARSKVTISIDSAGSGLKGTVYVYIR